MTHNTRSLKLGEPLGPRKGLIPVKDFLPTGVLSVFWVAMVAGRRLTSGLVLRVAPQRIWLLLPLLMIAAVLLLPYVSTPVSGIGLFALSCIACSAFFPRSIGIASERFRDNVPWVSSMLIAELMVGVALGFWLVGLLRGILPMEDLYRLSVCYPLLAFLLAIIALRASSRTARVMTMPAR